MGLKCILQSIGWITTRQTLNIFSSRLFAALQGYNPRDNLFPSYFNFIKVITTSWEVHYAGGIWQRNNNATTTRLWAGKSHCYCDIIVFESLRFQYALRPHEDKKPAFSHSSARFEEPFRKAQFSRRISVNGRPNRKNRKAAFPNFSSVVWKHLLGLKSVVCPSVVQVVTQTADNQTKTFQITHKLIHTSSLLKPNNMLFAYIMFSILLYMGIDENL